MTDFGRVSGQGGAKGAKPAKAAEPAGGPAPKGRPTPVRISSGDALVRSPGAAIATAFGDLRVGQTFNLVSGTRVMGLPVRGKATVVSVGPQGAEMLIEARVPLTPVKKIVRVTLRPGRDGMLHGRADQLTAVGGTVRENLWSARMQIVSSGPGRLSLREPSSGVAGGLSPTADGGFRLEAPGATFVARP